MILFNALQIVALFAIAPFLMVWLWSSRPFEFARIVSSVITIVYLFGFAGIVGLVYDHIESELQR